jgi:hypothetical protein
MYAPATSMAALVALLRAVGAYKTTSIDSWSDNPTNLGSAIVIEPDNIGDSPAIILGV